MKNNYKQGDVADIHITKGARLPKQVACQTH